MGTAKISLSRSKGHFKNTRTRPDLPVKPPKKKSVSNSSIKFTNSVSFIPWINTVIDIMPKNKITKYKIY